MWGFQYFRWYEFILSFLTPVFQEVLSSDWSALRIWHLFKAKYFVFLKDPIAQVASDYLVEPLKLLLQQLLQQLQRPSLPQLHCYLVALQLLLRCLELVKTLPQPHLSQALQQVLLLQLLLFSLHWPLQVFLQLLQLPGQLVYPFNRSPLCPQLLLHQPLQRLQQLVHCMFFFSVLEIVSEIVCQKSKQ